MCGEVRILWGQLQSCDVSERAVGAVNGDGGGQCEHVVWDGGFASVAGSRCRRFVSRTLPHYRFLFSALHLGTFSQLCKYLCSIFTRKQKLTVVFMVAVRRLNILYYPILLRMNVVDSICWLKICDVRMTRCAHAHAIYVIMITAAFAFGKAFKQLNLESQLSHVFGK